MLQVPYSNALEKQGTVCIKMTTNKVLCFSIGLYTVFSGRKFSKISFQAMNKSGEGLIEMRKMEASLEISRDLSRNQRITYLPNTNGGMLLNMGIDR